MFQMWKDKSGNGSILTLKKNILRGKYICILKM